MTKVDTSLWLLAFKLYFDEDKNISGGCQIKNSSKHCYHYIFSHVLQFVNNRTIGIIKSNVGRFQWTGIIY